MPSRSTLERAFDRAPRFLRAIARSPRVAQSMAKVGYAAEDHAQGWDLLHQAAGYRREAPSLVPASNPAADAMQTLDTWDERGFALARAALEWTHPEQAAFVFEGLTASTGAKAVLGVRTFLERIDALATQDDPKAAEAVDALAKVGIDANERARLAELVAQAAKPAPTVGADTVAEQARQTAEADEALEKLYQWFGRWSSLARATIDSRRDLIVLGLANRRSRSNTSAEIDDTPVTDDAPNSDEV